MIKVNHETDTYGLQVSGHANAKRNAEGHDLVCSAVSALMQTLLYTATKSGHMLDHETEVGFMRIAITPGQRFTRDLQIMFRTVEDGIEMLAQAYPECIEIDW